MPAEISRLKRENGIYETNLSRDSDIMEMGGRMEERYAKVIVDISQKKLDRPFTYRIPDVLQDQISVGTVVQVPFGKGSRMTRGYVVGLMGSTSISQEKIKEVLSVLTGEAELTGEDRLIALAAWMRDTYGSTMIQALKTVLPPQKNVRCLERRTLRLLLTVDDASRQLAFYEKKHQTARYRLLLALMEEKRLPWEIVTGKLRLAPAAIRAMEEQGVLKIEKETVYRNPVQSLESGKVPVTLSSAQRRTADAIWAEHRRVSLIFGVTGSGKTEVYMDLIARTLAEERQAIVLIPEIALTYQTVMRFYRRFGDAVSMLHSRLSAGEKQDQFQRARNGEISVMIGPRSALFTPFPRLGLIVIDEEHEPSYQSGSSPRYHARETAIRRAQLEGAKVVLGSATPSLEAYDRAKRGIYGLYTLEERACGSVLPAVEVTDMRRELREGNRSVFGRSLRDKIQERLNKKQQIMLFLNRRGYAGFVSCRACGKALMCPHCDVSLSLHRPGRMVCHYCGYETKKPEYCPQCGSSFLDRFGIGTQQVEQLVKAEFPEAAVLRMDMDTTRGKEGHEKILAAFAGQKADILIGTQMIVKGHDFPNVTLVGILAADLSLYAGDYRAGERTFQLLTQAAGRAGRGRERGEVVIQTFDPEHYCIRTAARQDYPAFFEEEMSYRQLAGYPPAMRMLSLHGTGRDEAHLALAMEYLKKTVLRMPEGRKLQILGPVQERIARIQDEYRMALYLKAEDGRILTSVKNKLEQYMQVNEGYQTVLIQFDRNE